MEIKTHSRYYPHPGSLVVRSIWNEAESEAPQTTLSQSREELQGTMRASRVTQRATFPSWFLRALGKDSQHGLNSGGGLGGWAGLLPGPWLAFPQRSCRNNCPTATDQIWWASENIFYQAFWMFPRLDSVLQKRQLHSW